MKHLKPSHKLGPDPATKDSVRNPFAKALADATVTAAAREAVERRAHDRFLLADIELRRVERDVAAAPVTESGTSAVPAATRRRFEGAARERHEAEGDYTLAGAAATAARGALAAAQQDVDAWVARERLFADLAAQRASETPAQTKARELREALECERASR